MGGRPHQRSAPAIDLLEQAGAQRLLGQFGPVEGQCSLVRKGAEEAALTPRQFDIAEHQKADRMVAHRERHRDSKRLRPARHPERTRVASARGQGGDVALGQGRSGRGGDLEHLAGCQCAAATGRKDQRGPTWSEDALHRVHNVRQQLRQVQVADECLGELIQTRCLLCTAEGILAGTPQLHHHLGHDEDHDDVDQQGDPVLRRPHCERVVGGQEEIVVEEEAAQGSDGSRQEAAQHDAEERRQDEEQRRDDDTHMRAQGQQDGEYDAEPGQRRKHPDNGALVPSHGEPAWLHVFRCFPRVRLSSECTDVVAGRGETRST